MLQQGHEVLIPVTQPMYVLFPPFIHCSFSLDFLALSIALCCTNFSRTNSLAFFSSWAFWSTWAGIFTGTLKSELPKTTLVLKITLFCKDLNCLTSLASSENSIRERLRKLELIYNVHAVHAEMQLSVGPVTCRGKWIALYIHGTLQGLMFLSF